MQKLKLTLIALTLGAICLAQGISFTALTCNFQDNPINVETTQPRLSWQVQAEGYARSQTAYQLVVATQENLLSAKKADVWNSGKIESAQSSLVKYQGSTLSPTTQYWWSVKIWDEKGKASDWSQAQTFETALMNDAQWGESKYMALAKDTRESDHRFRDYKTGPMPAPIQLTSQAVGYFRNEIQAEKEVKSARAYICGLGYYELYINGEKTGDHVLDPAPSNYDKQAYYVSYDVTSQLQKGTNAIGIILGNGFYGQDISWKRDPESEKDMSYGIPAARLLVKVTYADGSTVDFNSNEQWKASTGPIVFDNVYGGEIYDARYEIEGWNTQGFDAEEWPSVQIVNPKLKKVTAQQLDPIRKLKDLAVQRVFKSTNGNWIVDFGQNIAGWVEITVQEKEGQVIEMIGTEALTQDGTAVFAGSTGGGANGMSQSLKYICKGQGVETWEPRFTYHGFRYVEISGMTTTPSAENIKAVLVATDVASKGSFVCSDPLLNKMDTISRWTVEDNLHGIPEDCPHREKCGWLGDAHAFAEYALYSYDMLNFYTKYMEDIRTQMRQVNGHNPGTGKFMVPTMIAPGKRTSSIAKLDWGVATMYLPWYNYVYSGDSSLVLEYYADMKDLTNYYLSFKNEAGIIDDGMGDWCPPRWDRKRNPEAMECDPVISANAYFYDILGIMEKFATMAKDDTYAAQMQTEQTELGVAFNKAYMETIPMVNIDWYGSQTATVMALQFGMVPQDKIEEVVKGLEYNIVAVKGGHHAAGIHGLRYIYTVLNANGKADLAQQILTTPTFPSQTYVMNYGFTTWPERQFFWEAMDGLSNSLNHPMHSGFAAYFYESLGGIKSTVEAPGYKVFTVNPQFQKDITTTSVTLPSPYGTIANAWECKEGEFTMNLTVPFNTSAQVAISDKQLASLSVNGITLEQFQKKNKADWQNGTLVLGSGDYKLVYLR